MRVLRVLILLIAVVLAGCVGTTADEPRSDAYVVGEPVVLACGAQVTLTDVVRSDDGVLSIDFEVFNSTDASLALPSRPARPRLTSEENVDVRQAGSSASLDGGGGGWGPAAGHLGDPYLDPGGTMHATYEVELSEPLAQLWVTYAPLEDEAVEFFIP